jgi:hypothetical protein
MKQDWPAALLAHPDAAEVPHHSHPRAVSHRIFSHTTHDHALPCACACVRRRSGTHKTYPYSRDCAYAWESTMPSQGLCRTPSPSASNTSDLKCLCTFGPPP